MLIQFFDTETGGVDPDKHSVLSLGSLVGNIHTGEVVSAFECLISRPIDEYVVTDKAMEINGLDLKQCSREGIPPEAAADLLNEQFINNGCSMLGGHNVNFDIQITARDLFGITGQEFTANFTYRTIDTCGLIRMLGDIQGFASGAGLKNAVKAMGINVSDFQKRFKDSYMYKNNGTGYHTALFDSWCSFLIATKFRAVCSRPDVIKALKG